MVITIGYQTHPIRTGDSRLVSGGVAHRVESLSELRLFGSLWANNGSKEDLGKMARVGWPE